MSEAKFYFQCTTNPAAPLLELDSFWEAEEMKGHPDYVRVTAAGKPVKVEADSAAQRIPFGSPQSSPKSPARTPKKKA